MPFNNYTIGTTASPLRVIRNFQLRSATLSSAGLSLRRGTGAIASFSFSLGLTPLGDQDVQIYETLLCGLLSPGDGLTWSGSIKVTDNLFLCLNYISLGAVFAYITWTT